MTRKRLISKPFAKLINFNKTVNFNFEGKNYQGYVGDSIASALWANKQKILSRSFKYHRARGIFSLTGQDGNTFVSLPELGISNISADKYPITENLKVIGQNYSGSLNNDKLSKLRFLKRFLPVGFYYKAFYKNNSWDKIWHKFFRKFTGLGDITTTDSNRHYDKQYLFYDAVVVGGGLAGMHTALELDSKGAKVLLVDENHNLGGALNYSRLDQDGKLALKLKKKYTKLINDSSVNVMTKTSCNGVYSDNWLALICANRLYKVRAKQLMLCSGGFEQPLIFRNNDLPGIMLGSAAQRLMYLYGVKPGQKAVILTVDDNGYSVALDLIDGGVEVAAIVDIRHKVLANKITKALKAHKIRVLNHYAVYSAISNKDKFLHAVEIRALNNENKCTNDKGEVIECDLLAMSGYYMPAFQLPCYLGAKLNFDNKKNAFVIENISKDCHLAGGINQARDVDTVIKQANYIANNALNSLGLINDNPSNATPNDDKVNSEFIMPIFEHPKGDEFIDFDEDLKICDIVNSVREGYEDIQMVKRFSTFGMGPSQGRYTAFNGAFLVSSIDKQKKHLGKIGITTARPPYDVERIGHMAGRSFFPQSHSSIHNRHIELGAQMLIAGLWLRPAYYGDKKNMDRHIADEVLNVHNNVGIVDVSTLGGLEIRGPDAAEFLNRVYTWGYVKQPIGKARYAVLTNEAGVVVDDGVACRLSEEHYYVTATTSGVNNVYLQLLKWNAQWRLKIDIANVTSAWCGVNIAGPNSRKVLTKICDIDLSPSAFPYMAVKEAKISGVDARILRVGFVGELGFEVHVPQHCGEFLWDLLIAAGQEFNIKPFGIEAQRVLRLQKGHIIIGQDTDAMTYPQEVDLSWAVSQNKPFFVGKKSIEILNAKKQERILTGFEVSKHAKEEIKDSNLVFNDKKQLVGRITSCSYSPILKKTIGMAYIKANTYKEGDLLQIRCDNKTYVDVKIIAMPFYDPENKRQEL